MRILFSSHNDDESLFAVATILRFKPIVVFVTDSARQEGVTAEERRKESIEACKILGVPCEFMGIPDKDLTITGLFDRLRHLKADMVFAPALQHGHVDHDITHTAVNNYFGDKCINYATYTKDYLIPCGNFTIALTAKEADIKEKALACYKSQHQRCKGHFDSVVGGYEYWIV